MQLVVFRLLPLACLIAAGIGFGSSQNSFAQTTSAEITFWQSVRDSNDPSELEAYLKAFPQGQFAPLANIRLKKLRAAAGKRIGSKPPPAQRPPQQEKRADIPRPPPAKTRGWIGVQIRPVNDQRARELGFAGPSGAEIVSVTDYGPAARSGLKPRDVIVSAGGTGITDPRHLIRVISARKPNETVELTIVRDGARQTANFTIGDYFKDLWDAAQRGNPAAMLDLGNVYAGGNLVARDHRQANGWYRKATGAGNAAAMFALGRQYQTGTGVERNDREAFQWFRRAAEAGHADSIFSVGLLYYRGQGIERNFSEAVRWYKRAIEKGHSGAMHNYGAMLQDGVGVEKNGALALDYFRRAAKLGQRESFPSIASAYYTGRGVPKNLAQAARWYREAVNRGVSTGYSGLGMMYENGEGGLPKDRDEAIKYYRKGAEFGDKGAIDRLKKLNASPYDPKEVQRLLSDLGFDPGRIDGKPSRKTTQAIRAFQKGRGLAVDGRASLYLVGQLREALKRKAAAKVEAQTKSATEANATPAADLGELKDLEKLDTLK